MSHHTAATIGGATGASVPVGAQTTWSAADRPLTDACAKKTQTPLPSVLLPTEGCAGSTTKSCAWRFPQYAVCIDDDDEDGGGGGDDDEDANRL